MKKIMKVVQKDENRETEELTRECEEQINKQLLLIEEEKARLELERINKKKREHKKSSKSKNSRYGHPQKSSRDVNHKKRPHSHKKRGSASMMHELKKKMGWLNSQTSRGNL
jgi:hypothetical protein